MPRKRKRATVKPEPVPVTTVNVWGKDTVTGKRIYAKPGTKGFKPAK